MFDGWCHLTVSMGHLMRCLLCLARAPYPWPMLQKCMHRPRGNSLIEKGAQLRQQLDRYPFYQKG